MKITPLDKLRKAGTSIKSPLEKLGNIAFSSWVNEVLPDCLWSALLVTHLPRERALSEFRIVLSIIKENKAIYNHGMLVHSQIAKMDDKQFDSLFAHFGKDPDVRRALSPLLIVEGLPDKRHWQRLLGPDPLEDATKLLASAIAECFNHQSQASTDCRWLRVMTKIAQEKIVFPPAMQEKFEQIVNYPKEGDMRSVRPSIRAMELATREAEKNGSVYYNEAFWVEFWQRTECIFTKDIQIIDSFDRKLLLEKIVEIDNLLATHFCDTISTTNIDPRHDGAFGLVFYLSHLLALITAQGSGKTVLGRLMLRAAVEVYITLSYLTKKDDNTVWLQFRNYGNGQNKLSYLKHINITDKPDFISKEILEEFLDEDIWHEYLDIKLGAWDGKDLRKMAIDASEKDFYDRYYDVLSGYTHGNWMAIRHLIFGQCLNPLHRYHRMPLPPRILVEDAIPDLIKIFNLALDRLNIVYPPFKLRLHTKTFAKSGKSGDKADSG